MPQSKADSTFLQQCVVKLNGALQVLQHVKDLKATKDYDEQQAANAIRSLEGRQTKILQSGFAGMRGTYLNALKQTRDAGDPIKAVKSFENKQRIRKQAASGRAALKTVFDKLDAESSEEKLDILGS